MRDCFDRAVAVAEEILERTPGEHEGGAADQHEKARGDTSHAWHTPELPGGC